MAGLLEQTVKRWAQSTCSLFPCGEEVYAYACEVAGVELVPLPVHQTRKQVADLLRAQGGLVNYAGSLVEAIGWTKVGNDPIDRAQRGDVGVISLPGMGPTCAICLGDTWVAKGDKFVLVSPAEAVHAVWRFRCPKQ